MDVINKFAVKAVIYNSKGQLLLQKRDNKPNIPMPNFWNFFGGLVETNETPIMALKREIKEELKLTVANNEPKLFEWKYGNEWNSSINYFYPILYDESLDKLILSEGSDLKWYTLEELIRINCTPSIFENFSALFNFIKFKIKIDYNNFISRLEKMILVNFNLIKKNERVFYSKHNFISFNRQKIFLLREFSIIKSLPIFRVCMHNNDSELVHEMLMFHNENIKVGPLKQEKSSISYNIISGELLVTLHEKNDNEFKLNSNLESLNDLNFIRVQSNIPRTIKNITKRCIFVETNEGPFNDKDTIWLNKK